MLPPGLDMLPTHHYGSFQCLFDIESANMSLQTVGVSLLGMRQAQKGRVNDSQGRVCLGIGTNLWHFYAYLHDARTVTLTFTDEQRHQYTSQVDLMLMPSAKVLNPAQSIEYLFRDNAYLVNCRQQIGIDGQEGRVGTAWVEFRVNFVESLHRIIHTAQLINLSHILVIDTISPINSAVELPPDPKKQPQVRHMTKMIEEEGQKSLQKEVVRLQAEPMRSIEPIRTQLIPQMEPVETDRSQQVEQGLNDEEEMEADIDRMIAEMQNKPYDSSKYLENSGSIPLNNENYNMSNAVVTRPVGHSRSREKSERKLSTQRPPVPPRQPHTPPPTRTAYPLNYTQQGHSPLRSSDSSFLNNTQMTHLNRSGSRSVVAHQAKSGIVRMKIHELMSQHPEQQLGLVLKVYINEQAEEIHSANGVKQGENYSFSTNLTLQQANTVSSLRFELIDAYDLKTVIGVGIFEMERLFSVNPIKGTFMVTIAPGLGERPRVVKINETQLNPVTPTLRTLRIELEYEQPIQIVQIYLALDGFSQQVNKIRYKIPMTKETIQFQTGSLPNQRHINIFPHNRLMPTEKLILEVWGQKQLIGMEEVSLKPLSNTNQQIINSSLEPIYLYDEKRSVSAFGKGKQKTSLGLYLCYGTVAQVQGLLNRDNRRQAKKEVEKKPVEVQQHLGIYVKEAKVKKEVEVQVDQPVEVVANLSKKMSMELQQEELNDDQEDDTPTESKLDSSNEFLRDSMRDLGNKQTFPILNDAAQGTVPVQKQLDFSQTRKSKPNPRLLTASFQQKIKNCLSQFKDEARFSLLKEQCKPHLLYNIIDQSVLMEILGSLGMTQAHMDYLTQEILVISNSMVNVNLLYDMIFGLILDGEVKEKFINDQQIGRYCLKTLYCELRDGKCASKGFLMDDEVEFSQAKKVFEDINYKVTMREFKLMQQYQAKQKESNNNITDEDIKTRLLQLFDKKVQQEQSKKQYEKEIVSQIYQAEWDEDDDFFIANINQPTPARLSDVQQAQQAHFVPSDVSLQTPNNTTKQSDILQTQRNVESELYLVQKPHHERQSQNQCQMHNMKKKTGSIVPIIATSSPNSRLVISSLKNCIETAECHLDLAFTSPLLRLSYNLPSGPSDLQTPITTDTLTLDLSVADRQYLDGTITLLNGGEPLSQCKFSVMEGLKSSYTLKSIDKGEFCGLVGLQFRAV